MSQPPHRASVKETMNLESFRVFNYRNIHDSGPIQVNRITGFVGQNECGKSNLFRALCTLNPFDDRVYSQDTDWPVDRWPAGDPSEIVAKATFSLLPGEITELFAFATDSPQVSAQASPDYGPVAANPFSPPPATLSVTAYKGYDNKLHIELDEISEPDRFNLERAEHWIAERLPKCLYMEDYGIFRGHVELDQLTARLQAHGRDNLSSEEETILVALDLAELRIEDLHSKAGSEQGRTLRAFDTRAASLHLTRRFAHTWKQKPLKFEIRVDGPSLDIHVEDEGLGTFVPLESRSRGFQWFVSFVWRFTHASKGKFSNCVLLLDEPGIFLHHAGHRDLLDYFEEFGQTNTLLYTTHLATMLDTAYPERIRIVEVWDHHGAVKNDMVSSQKEPMMVIESALGLAGGLSELLGSRQTLIVEGGDVVVILSRLSGVLRDSTEEGLSDRIFLLPADGTSKTPTYAAFMVGNGFDAGVLLDSDAEGFAAKKKISEKYPDELAEEKRKRFRVLMLGDAVKSPAKEFAIEDLFPVEFYLECINEAFSTNLKVADLPDDVGPQNRKRAEAALINRGRIKKLNRNLVLPPLVRRFDTFNLRHDLPQGTYEKAKALIQKINSIFKE
ncbi:MAG TPA: hypothetical protein VEZ90_19405 [Blastocatellia bacterium]|nr:hypothetical protein [Blastocatellia bacterium]